MNYFSPNFTLEVETKNSDLKDLNIDLIIAILQIASRVHFLRENNNYLFCAVCHSP
jgi:hypothetical protein